MMHPTRRSTARDVVMAEPPDARPAPRLARSSGTRPVARAQSSSCPAVRERVKILFLAANTGAHDQLALDLEYRAIEDGIRAGRYRDAFQLIPKLAARPSDLQQALLEHRPDVVHFACHGTSQAELVLLAERGGNARISSGALASTLRVLRDNVTLVVLNACFSGEQAQAIRQSAGLAIGVHAQIADTAAIAFASALYGALAYGRSVRDAFDLGIAAIQAAHPQQEALPELFEKPGLDASSMALVDEALRPTRRSWVLGGAAACASLALVWWLLRVPERREPPPSSSHGMVQFPRSTHGATSRDRAGSSPPPVAFDSAPLTLQIGLRISGSKDGPLRDGDTVMSNDHIQVFAQTTEDAHLYIAYCTEDRKLTMFPMHGSISTPAGKTIVAPSEQTALVLDDHGGSEALYVILSRAELSSADPRLADAIDAARPGEPAADCGPRFEAAVTSSSSESSATPTSWSDQSLWIGRDAAPDAGPDPGMLRPQQAPDGGIAAVHSEDDDERPLVTIERGMYVGHHGLAEVTTHADANGIAILRYRFKHVAAPRP